MCHSKDTIIAESLQKALGCGFSTKTKKGLYLRFLISSAAGLKKVLELTNGNVLFTFKLQQIPKHNYTQRFGIQLPPPFHDGEL